MREKSIIIIGPSKRFLSGISYYTIRLSNALSQLANVKVILFREMLPKTLFPGRKRIGKNLTNLKFDDKIKVYELLDWYNPLTWIKAYCISKRSNVIILQWWTASVAHMYLAMEILNKMIKNVPIIIEFHEVVDPLENSILPIKVYSRIMGKVVRKLANHYVVHSKSDKTLISKVYRIPPEKVSIIPHGIYDHYPKIDKEVAKKKLNISENFVILFFGLLRPYKGVKYLIKAFEQLPEEIISDSRLLIVGEAWEDKESIKLANNSKYSDKITVINKYVPDNEVPLYFSASDVLVLPYTRASQSGVAHIAMAFGLPIIATKVGGLKEALSKYSGTTFIPPKSVKGLTEALIKVYKQKGKIYDCPSELKWSSISRIWMSLINKIKK